jgi:hypothetical protein
VAVCVEFQEDLGALVGALRGHLVAIHAAAACELILVAVLGNRRAPPTQHSAGVATIPVQPTIHVAQHMTKSVVPTLIRGNTISNTTTQHSGWYGMVLVGVCRTVSPRSSPTEARPSAAWGHPRGTTSSASKMASRRWRTAGCRHRGFLHTGKSARESEKSEIEC